MIPKPHKAILRLHISLTAYLIPIMVHTLSLRSILFLLTPPRDWQPYRNISPEEIQDQIHERLSNPACMIRRACLREGMMLYHFLRLTGREAVLHIGVHPQQSKRRLRAHCWVSAADQLWSYRPGNALAEILAYPKAKEDRISLRDKSITPPLEGAKS